MLIPAHRDQIGRGNQEATPIPERSTQSWTAFGFGHKREDWSTCLCVQDRESAETAEHEAG
jgi:hypothetical protein